MCGVLMFDEEPDWTTLLLIGGLIYLGSKAVGAVKTISREVQKFERFGLTTDEDEQAQKVIADPKAPLPAKLAAIATLRKKVEGARERGYSAQVAALGTALDLYEKALQPNDELEAKRRQWEKDQKTAKAPAKW
jgi:hypothetical protein